ncbi:hypothetical protein SLEP1_g28131 [Rubroshorea leprosula]|uniref:Reverse transcriptase n=1 Tax=Rubroshorea leprosula TaxID=152421 RepID=A0AAV5JZS9_9ROSI|nr:hypothetical protein SLEP1_g28131 [Rubroshorea leprosula]
MVMIYSLTEKLLSQCNNTCFYSILHVGRGSRLVVAPIPEEKFELDGTGNDETQFYKGDSPFQSRVGEEEMVEMVADSFDMEIEEDDVDDRERVGECEAEFEKGRQMSLGLLASSGRIVLGLQPQPNPKTLGQQNRTVEPRGKEAWVCEKGLEILQLGEHSRPEVEAQKEATQCNANHEKIKSILENSSSFWEGLGSEDGSEKEWMRVMSKQGKQKRKKKVKACSVVYKRSLPLEVMNQKKKGKGISGSSQAKEEETSQCHQSTSNSVAGGSVGDSGIQNCNRRLNKVPNKRIAAELWNFAKRIGAVTEEEELVIRKFEEMEKRDRATKEETKKCGLDRNYCKRLWHSEDFEWVGKDSVGRSGRLLCVWNSKAINVKHVWEGENFIGIQGVWIVENVAVNVVNVYCPCQLAGKRILWLELKILVLQSGGMWSIVGDFNAVQKVEEKIGSSRLTIEMGEFDNFIRDSGLIDIPLVGRKLTWYQIGGKFMSRIDRALLSEEWLSKWGEATQWGLSRIVSDHCPILLRHKKVNWGPKPFRFFDIWLEQKECRELIRKAWEQANIQGWAGFQLKEKLKITKEALKKWSKSFVPEIDNRIKEATAQIEQLDLKGESEQLVDEEIDRRR